MRIQQSVTLKAAHFARRCSRLRTCKHARNVSLLLLVLTSLSPGNSLAKPDALTAARFLSQATLGYTESQITDLQASGMRKWIQKQQKIQPTRLEPYIDALASRYAPDTNRAINQVPYHKVKSKGNNVGYRNLNTAWMRAVLGGDDQLRQRVAWALSQIIVTSNTNNRLTKGTSNYYDLLLEHAFSPYEELLTAVTFHPVMGRYLSYMGNKKPNADQSQQPDENYAREIMQLFSIGLWMLNSDGSQKLDDNGEPIPTYSNSDITELARVFTGFWISNRRFGKNSWAQYHVPMILHEQHHDKQVKSLLEGHLQIPAGMSADREIRFAVSRLTQHPNVAPFMSKKLINHLVTSNPTSQYVARISAVWQKTNGNLGTVVEAILLDTEARDPQLASQPRYGRLKDPIQRVTNILIGFECGADLGKEPRDYPGLQWWRPAPIKHLTQAPMQAPSVFNFYESDYSRPGMVADNELYSPEFQILNDASASAVPNYLWKGLSDGFHKARAKDNGLSLVCSFEKEKQQSIDDVLMRANLLLAAGAVDTDTLGAIKNLVSTQRNKQIEAAVFAIAISPSATVQR